MLIIFYSAELINIMHDPYETESAIGRIWWPYFWPHVDASSVVFVKDIQNGGVFMLVFYLT